MLSDGTDLLGFSLTGDHCGFVTAIIEPLPFFTADVALIPQMGKHKFKFVIIWRVILYIFYIVIFVRVHDQLKDRT